MHQNRLIFLLILVLAVFLRVLHLGKDDTWSDEKLSVTEANGLLNYDIQRESVFTLEMIQSHNTLQNVCLSTIQGDGGNGILYITILHYWTKAFGNSDFAVRMLSLIAGVLLVIVVYMLAKELFKNPNVALLCMILVTIHPRLISCSQETRAYSLALLLATSATYLLVYIANNRDYHYKHLTLYALAVAAAFLSHYSTIYILATHLVILFVKIKFEWRTWMKLLPFGLMAITIIFLWLIHYGFDGMKLIAMRNHNYTELSKQDPTNTFYMQTGFYSILAGWFQNLLSFSGITLTNLGFRILMVMPLLTIPLYLLFIGIKQADKKYLPSLYLLAVLSISSLLYATVLSLKAGHIIAFQHIYSVFSSPYFIVLLGFSIYSVACFHLSKIHRAVNFIIISLQMVVMLISTSLIYLGFDTHTHKGNDYQTIAEEISQAYANHRHNFVIHYNNELTAKEVNKYLHRDLTQVHQIIDDEDDQPKVSLTYEGAAEPHIIFN